MLETEQNAVETERDTTDLKMTEYMVPFVGEPFDAHITGLTRFGIFVGLDNGVEGLVHIDSMDDDEYVYQEDTMTFKRAARREEIHHGNAGACDPCQSG